MLMRSTTTTTVIASVVMCVFLAGGGVCGEEDKYNKDYNDPFSTTELMEHEEDEGTQAHTETLVQTEELGDWLNKWEHEYVYKALAEKKCMRFHAHTTVTSAGPDCKSLEGDKMVDDRFEVVEMPEQKCIVTATWGDDRKTLTGRRIGNAQVIKVSGSYHWKSGVVTHVTVLTVHGTHVAGTSKWMWRQGAKSCQGESSIIGTQVSSQCPSSTGVLAAVAPASSTLLMVVVSCVLALFLAHN